MLRFSSLEGPKYQKEKNENNPIWHPLVQENFGNFISKIMNVF